MTNKLFLFLSFIVFITFISCSNHTKSLKEKIIEIDSANVLRKADLYLSEPVETITDTSCDRSAGGLHDYFSEGTYWWPDSTNPGGPFIRKDGYKNPDNFTGHSRLLLRLHELVPTLVAAFIITDEEKYATAAKKHILGWFVNEETKMNPHMLYGQAIHGIVTGRRSGIIDSREFVEVIKACMILEEKRVLKGEELDNVKQWVREFNTWLTTHRYGIEERDWGNNHSTFWTLQVAMFAKFTGDEPKLEFCRNFYKQTLLRNQMVSNGSFPHELARTKPYAYSAFNLEGLVALCLVASTEKDRLWDYTYQDSLNIRKGVDFMLPYLEDKSKWPYHPDVASHDNHPLPYVTPLCAYMAYGDEKYFEVWKSIKLKLKEYPERYAPIIRQPILWNELYPVK